MSGRSSAACVICARTRSRTEWPVMVLLIQNFKRALQDDVFAGFAFRLVRVGMHRFAVFVGLELRLRLLHNLPWSYTRILNRLAARRAVFRHREDERRA